MTAATNLLGADSAFFETDTGDWVATTNCTIARGLKNGPMQTYPGSGVGVNSLRATASGAGDMTVTSGKFRVDRETTYGFHSWIGCPSASTARTIETGFTFYDANGDAISGSYTATSTEFSGGWIRLTAWATSPADAYHAEVYATWESATTGEIHYVSIPSVVKLANYAGTFTLYALAEIPDYILEEDDRLVSPEGWVGRPFRRWLSTVGHPFDGPTDTIRDWDYIRATDTEDGVESLSTLTDPYGAEEEWLQWLASLVGVRTVTLGGTKTPWIAFTDGSISTWTQWEESIVPGGAGPDTTWTELEGFGAGYFDTSASARHQIASTYNGIAAGRRETTRQYIKGLLNSNEDDPWTFVRKHYRANPYKILSVVQEKYDPDPTGDMLAIETEASAALGTAGYREHGMRYSALHLYDPQIFIPDAEELDQDAPNELTYPMTLIQDELGRGRHIVLADFASGSDFVHGGGVALGKFYDGHALFSGCVHAQTAASATLNVTTDLDIHVLFSDFPSSIADGPADRLIAYGGTAATTKWALYYVRSNGYLKFTWTDSGSTLRTATSTASPNWTIARPRWIKVSLDLDNGASDHEVSFWEGDSEVAMSQVGDTVDAGTSATTSLISLSSPDPYVRVLDNATTRDGAAGIIYRTKVYGGGTLLMDMDFTRTDNADLYPGTTSFNEEENSIAVTVSGSADDGNWDISRWIALPHAGTDYFYFGKVDAGNGDSLQISGMSSTNYDYKVFYLDGTDSGAQNIGITTSYTFNSTNSDVEGKAITKIELYQIGTSTVLYRFDPTNFFSTTPAQTSKADPVNGSATWTLTRLWDTTNYYEYSSYIDRPTFLVAGEVGTINNDFVINYRKSFSLVVAYQRYWDTTGTTNIFDQRSSGDGLHVYFDGDNLKADLYGATTEYNLVWDEATDSRTGLWNLAVVRFDCVNTTFELIVNGTSEDSETSVDLGDAMVTSKIATVHGTGNLKDWQFFHLGFYDRAITDAEIAILLEELSIN